MPAALHPPPSASRPSAAVLRESIRVEPIRRSRGSCLPGCISLQGCTRGYTRHTRGYACGHRRVYASAAAAAAPSSTSTSQALLDWLTASGFPDVTDKVRIKKEKSPAVGAHQDFTLTAARRLNPGDVIFNIPENFSVTALDVASHPVLAPATSTVADDLALLALWLLWETSQVDGSPWAPYVRTFKTPLLSPLLWSEEERSSLLRGYSGLSEIESRLAEIDGYYRDIDRSLLSSEPSKFPSDGFSLQKFREAFVSILSRAIGLPEAAVFALVPVADLVRHGATSTNVFAYDADRQAVVLKSDRTLEPGQEILVCRTPELSNFDLALQCGEAFESNPNDFVLFPTALVPGDPLLLLKKQILQEEGFAETAAFPLFPDRFPRQLLSYLRLARLQDAAQFPKVTFKADVVVSESNEYEVLMLVLNDCKERLQAYPQNLEDDVRLVRSRTAPAPSAPSGLLQSLGGFRGPTKTDQDTAKELFAQKERLAAQLRASEKTILNSTVTALRNRLAPIRGIPTKSGMGDPNAEIKEVFELMEAGFSAPKKIFSDIMKRQKK